MKQFIEKLSAKSLSFLFLAFLTIGASSLTSCKKYLEEKQDNRLVVPHTLADLQALLDNNTKMNLSRTPSFGEASADNYFLTDNSYNNSVSDRDRERYIWQVKDYNGISTGDWASGYIPVFYANYCLDQLSQNGKTVINNESWENIKGSALFFRSYYFLGFAWQYAQVYDNNTSEDGLGIVLRLTSNSNVKSKRASVQATYDRIIEDAKEASTYLPDLPEHVMRPSRCAAYGLLARTYLSMRLYDSAYKYADLTLRIKNDLLDYNNASDVDVFSLSPFQPFNKEVIFFSSQTYSGPANPSISFVDTALFSSYGDDDLRKFAFFKKSGKYYSYKGNYNIDKSSYFFSGITTDEMYLIKAECEARLGMITDAMNELNKLLGTRWKSGSFIPLTASDKEGALAIILKERRKELLMRGLRWIDIKRLNEEGRNIILKRIINGETYTLMPGDNYYALPLPSDIIGLTGMPQNP